MPRRRYRHTWDEVSWQDTDWMHRGWESSAFDGWSGEMETSGVTLKAHGEHDTLRDVFSVFYVVEGHQPTRATIKLERRPQAKGGTRIYFIAPCCGRSVRKLAFMAHGAICGGCGSITQPTRRKGKTQRLIHRADMLACKLGCDNWFSEPKERPKGMHRKTFEDLAQRHAEAVRDAMRVIGPRLARAQARGPAAYIGALVRAGM